MQNDIKVLKDIEPQKTLQKITTYMKHTETQNSLPIIVFINHGLLYKKGQCPSSHIAKNRNKTPTSVFFGGTILGFKKMIFFDENSAELENKIVNSKTSLPHI